MKLSMTFRSLVFLSLGLLPSLSCVSAPPLPQGDPIESGPELKSLAKAKPILALRQVIPGNSLLARSVSPRFAPGISGPDAIIYDNNMALVAFPITAPDDGPREYRATQLTSDEVETILEAVKPVFKFKGKSKKIGEPIDSRALRLELLSFEKGHCRKLDANGRFLPMGYELSPDESQRDIIPADINAAFQSVLALESTAAAPWYPSLMRVHLGPAAALNVEPMPYLDQPEVKRDKAPYPPWPAAKALAKESTEWPGASHLVEIPIAGAADLDAFNTQWESVSGKDIDQPNGALTTLGYEAQLPGESAWRDKCN